MARRSFLTRGLGSILSPDDPIHNSLPSLLLDWKGATDRASDREENWYHNGTSFSKTTHLDIYARPGQPFTNVVETTRSSQKRNQ